MNRALSKDRNVGWRRRVVRKGRVTNKVGSRVGIRKLISRIYIYIYCWLMEELFALSGIKFIVSRRFFTVKRTFEKVSRVALVSYSVVVNRYPNVADRCIDSNKPPRWTAAKIDISVE